MSLENFVWDTENDNFNVYALIRCSLYAVLTDKDEKELFLKNDYNVTIKAMKRFKSLIEILEAVEILEERGDKEALDFIAHYVEFFSSRKKN